MLRYKLSSEAKEDLIRIHLYSVDKFGMKQADKYFDSFFEHFDLISNNPYSYESVDYIRRGYRRCVNGPYSIYLRVIKEFIEIMSLVGKQDLNDKLNNL